MTTLSTHDTKRSEDVRARLLALAEDIEGWDAAWAAVREQTTEYHVDEPTAYLLFQTLLGAWPLEPERLVAYMEKATHEAKQHTSWNDPDERYEFRVGDFAARCLEGDVGRDVRTRAGGQRGDDPRRRRSPAKLLQLTLPGVPDVYQGNEILAHALVDPDNRRPVDYERRCRPARAPRRGARADGLDAEKLWVTSRTLRAAPRAPGAVRAGAVVRAARSPARRTRSASCAPARVATVVTRWPGLLARSGWRGRGDRACRDGTWHDVLSDAMHRIEGGSIACADAARGTARRAAAARRTHEVPGVGAVRGAVRDARARRRAPRHGTRRRTAGGRPSARRSPAPRYAFAIDGGEPRADPRALVAPGRAGRPGARGRPRRTRPGRGLAPASSSRGAAIYELHVGTFTPEGTLDAAIERLDHLVELGVEHRRGDAARELPGPPRLGLRRRRPVRRARALRRAARVPALRRRLPRARPRRAASTSSTTTSGRAATTSASSGRTSPTATRRRGATPSTSTATAATRCAASSSTTRSCGCATSASTGCASTRCTRCSTTGP